MATAPLLPTSGQPNPTRPNKPQTPPPPSCSSVLPRTKAISINVQEKIYLAQSPSHAVPPSVSIFEIFLVTTSGEKRMDSNSRVHEHLGDLVIFFSSKKKPLLALASSPDRRQMKRMSLQKGGKETFLFPFCLRFPSLSVSHPHLPAFLLFFLNLCGP